MTSTVADQIEIDRPVDMVYNQWTQFEEFPRFMGGVESVRQLDDRTLHWKARIGGVTREWDARIVEQQPDQRIAWENTNGTTNRGVVSFRPIDAAHTMVSLRLEFEGEGFVEKAGEKLGIVESRAKDDLGRFKDYIEGLRGETGAWRGQIHDDEPRSL